ncbi:MAG: ABC transporter substrate-binding protein [SAR324 cluster bacterium]|nr:ABC transporter substrate-binding protein [SAR324 cluster bacterium]
MIQAKDEVVLAIEAAPKTLDPRYAVDAFGMRMTQQLLYETLIYPDINLKMVPGLAERWETPAPDVLRFFLKQGIQFNDGSALTAEDVKSSFQTVMEPETGSPFQFLGTKIKAIRVIDARTIEFQLTEPQSSILWDLLLPIFKASTNRKNFYGTGPFLLKEQTPNEIVFVPNPGYPDPVSYKKLVFKIIQDDNTRFLKIRKGEIDLAINTIPFAKVGFLQESNWSNKYDVIESPGLSYQYLGFNMNHPILKHKEVRQAIAHAINIDELIQFHQKGHSVRANSLITPQNEFYIPNLPQYNYNPDKAKQLLDQDFPIKNGIRFALEYKTTTKREAVTQARIIQSQLKQVGIDINIRSFEWGTFFTDIKSGNFELFSLLWVGVAEPDFYYTLFHTSQIPPEGKNRGHFSLPRLDNLLEQGRREMDIEKRKKIYREVQTILSEELPYVSMWHNNNIALIDKKLHGFQLHPAGGYYSLKSLNWK